MNEIVQTNMPRDAMHEEVHNNIHNTDAANTAAGSSNASSTSFPDHIRMSAYMVIANDANENTDVMDPATLFALNERVVAVESCWFAARVNFCLSCHVYFCVNYNFYSTREIHHDEHCRFRFRQYSIEI